MDLQEDLLLGEASGLIGIDEAGKGDYFGPLVIAGCYSSDEIDLEFEGFGLRESKKVSDRRTFALEAQIKKVAPFVVVAIGPEKYNELYSKIRNLNKLLAWGHSRALENLLGKVNPLEVIADQFGDKRFIENALMQKGRGIRLTQRPRAENVLAVAAASILARAEFLRRLDRLSKQYSMKLPKGTGPPVDAAARKF
ncbi:MAG: ribonuclease HIII, partial [candidate division Zixibacteria bacterium]